MKEDSRSVAAAGPAEQGLLVVQVALSLVLIIGAGALSPDAAEPARRRHRVQSEQPADVQREPGAEPLRRRPLRAAVPRRCRSELNAVPGVRSAALTRVLLLSGSTSTSPRAPAGRHEDDGMHMMTVSPEFFETMEIPLLAGRAVRRHRQREIAESRDREREPPRGSCSRASPPSGSRIGFSPEKSSEYEIIGVSRDTKYNSLREPAPPTMYQLLSPEPGAGMNCHPAHGRRPGGDDRDRPRRRAARRSGPAADEHLDADRSGRAALRAGAAASPMRCRYSAAWRCCSLRSGSSA